LLNFSRLLRNSAILYTLQCHQQKSVHNPVDCSIFTTYHRKDQLYVSVRYLSWPASDDGL